MVCPLKTHITYFLIYHHIFFSQISFPHFATIMILGIFFEDFWNVVGMIIGLARIDHELASCTKHLLRGFQPFQHFFLQSWNLLQNISYSSPVLQFHSSILDSIACSELLVCWNSSDRRILNIGVHCDGAATCSFSLALYVLATTSLELVAHSHICFSGNS